MTYRFLFDECMALELMGAARERGYQATSVRDLGRLGQSDRSLALYAVDRKGSITVTDWPPALPNELP